MRKMSLVFTEQGCPATRRRSDLRPHRCNALSPAMLRGPAGLPSSPSQPLGPESASAVPPLRGRCESHPGLWRLRSAGGSARRAPLPLSSCECRAADTLTFSAASVPSPKVCGS